MSSNFWLYDPSILLKKEEMLDFWPHEKQSLAKKLNSVTRSILILTTLGYLSTKSFNILISGIITLVVIVALYKTKSQENFDLNKRTKNASKELNNLNINELAKTLTKPTNDNPYMNYMPMDYLDNPNKKPALPLFNNKVKKLSDDAAFSHLDPRLLNSLGDAMEYDIFARNFYTMPSTTNPGDQKAFAEFCYGNMKSCKEGDCFGFVKSCKENNYLCKPSYDQEEEEKEKEEEEGGETNIDFTNIDSETLTAFQNLNQSSATYKKDVKKLFDPNISREEKIKLGLIKTDNLFGQKKAV
jgi:hypothetical protein